MTGLLAVHCHMAGGATKGSQGSMIANGLGGGPTAAGAPSASSVGDVVLIVLDHVVGPAPEGQELKEAVRSLCQSGALSPPCRFALTAAPQSHLLSSLDVQCKTAAPLASCQPLLCLGHPFPTSSHGRASHAVPPSPAWPLRPPLAQWAQNVGSSGWPFLSQTPALGPRGPGCPAPVPGGPLDLCWYVAPK